MLRIAVCLALWLLAGFTGPAWAQALPVFSDTGPDAAAYGAAEAYPIGDPGKMVNQRTIVGAYSHFDELHLSRVIPAAPVPSRFERAAIR